MGSCLHEGGMLVEANFSTKSVHVCLRDAYDVMRTQIPGPSGRKKQTNASSAFVTGTTVVCACALP